MVHVATAEGGALWLVIGGLALISRGVRRLTTDIDGTVRGDAITAGKVLDTAARHGIVSRIPHADAFARRNLVLLLRHAPSGVDLDVSLAWSNFEHEALEARSEAKFGRVRVAGRTGLAVRARVFAWSAFDLYTRRSSMRPLLVGTLLGVLAASGCGGAATLAQLRDLRVRLDASEQARIEQSRRLEELDNRVFLLTDQVESQKVALAQRGGVPRLPVVTLKPGSPVAAQHDSVLIGPAASDLLPEPEPPTTINDRGRPTITLSGDTTPWLGPDRDGPQARPEGSPRLAHAAPPSARVAPSPVVVGRRAPRPVSPPTEQGLGVTHGKPPLVDQVVGGQAEAPAKGAPTPVSALAVAPANGAPAPLAAPPVAPVAEPDPTSLYRAAYGRLKAGQAVEAADDLRGFVSRFPQHDLADNAQYWLGESYYTRGDYKDAEPEFRAVIRRWPSGNKAPDALLKLGYCMLQLGERAEGRTTLEQLVEHYPRTEAALLAQKRLAELSPEGKR